MTPAPTAVVRAWARANGYSVSDRGRIPAEIQQAYAEAHPEADRVEDLPSPADTGQQVPQPGQQPWPAPPQQAWPGQPQQPWPAQQPWPGQQWGPPPGTQPWGPPPIDQGRDGFAVAALVLGILPFCAGILGIVFGIIALNRIAGTAKRGRGMAIAGIVCGSLWIVAIIAAFAFDVSGQPGRDAIGTVTVAGDVDVSDLKVGDCADHAPEGTTYTVHLVPCSSPHGAEVFAQFDLEGLSYPGSGEVDRFAAAGAGSTATSGPAGPTTSCTTWCRPRVPGHRATGRSPACSADPTARASRAACAARSARGLTDRLRAGPPGRASPRSSRRTMANCCASAHARGMDAGVRLECRDCGSTVGLVAQDHRYLHRARSFVAAHQLCRPRSVVVHVAEPAPCVLNPVPAAV